ncbi:MAG: hypothetical protein HY903_21220 [Deltaproteobacteria bacterium]|nr:hypothetical protein [Deltaproteobacteria bacterium]
MMNARTSTAVFVACLLGACDNAPKDGDGPSSPPCTADGDCAAGEYCGPDGACLSGPRPTCATLDDCVTPPVCRTAAGAACQAGTCVYAALADGVPCDAGSGALRCLGGSCVDCANGDCCVSNSDCAAFSIAAYCVDAGTCQGQRQDGYCGPAHLCLTRVVADDSGCDGRVAADCGRYQDAVCTNSPDQSPPICRTSCESTTAPSTPNPGLCDPGLACATAGSSFVCTPMLAAGDCCGGPSCPSGVCAADLHCGDTQSPEPAYVCCASGERCCRTDADCPADPNLVAPCDFATSTCASGCGENDNRCNDGYHCDAGLCVADLAPGEPCSDASDCGSRHCTPDLLSGVSTCAPAGSCPAAGELTLAGFVHCFADAELARCETGGVWSEFREPSPDVADDLCQNGVGYDLAASCTPTGFTDPPCQSCGTFRAASAQGCFATCAVLGVDTDGRCSPGNHCENGTCIVGLADGAPCQRDSQCSSRNCAADLGYDHPDSCAAADTCVDEGATFPVNGGFCVAAPSSYWRCTSEGVWALAVEPNPQPAAYLCDPGTGANTGVDPAATCGAAGFTNPDCVTCIPYRPWTTSLCYTGCAVDNSSYCAAGYHCLRADDRCYANTDGNPCDYDWECGSGLCRAAVCAAKLVDDEPCSRDLECISTRCDDTCMPLLANGEACDEDGDCLSWRCDATCQDRLADGELCDEASDCLSGACATTCYTPTTSCPFIYAWDGAGWRYETDDATNVLGIPPKGQPMTEVTTYGPKYILLDPPAPDRDGLLRIKVRETLREMDYVDELTLVAIDHPLGTGVVSSTAMGDRRELETLSHRLTTYRAPKPPIAAINFAGQDSLAAVLARDGVPVAANPAGPDLLTLDFGAVDDLGRARLVIDGWALFGNRYAHDNPVRSEVRVLDAAGRWVTARTMGFPAGDEKRMVVDLTGLFRATDSRVQIVLGSDRRGRVRWVIDSVGLDTSTPEATLSTEIRAAYAYLGHKGVASHQIAEFEHRILAADDAAPVSEPSLSYGDFTRLGEVTELVTARDDLYVVMQHGDELVLSFPDPGAPPPGMQRSFMLKSDLYYKQYYWDRDAAPMPFHQMSAYPYPATESYPQDATHQTYIAAYNTRRYEPLTSAVSLSAQPPLAAARLQLLTITDDCAEPGVAPLATIDQALATALVLETTATLVGADAEPTHRLLPVLTGNGARCALTATAVDVPSAATAYAATVDVDCEPQAIIDATTALVRALTR